MHDLQALDSVDGQSRDKISDVQDDTTLPSFIDYLQSATWRVKEMTKNFLNSSTESKIHWTIIHLQAATVKIQP